MAHHCLGRVFQSNVPSLTQDGITWSDFVEKLNPELRIPPPPDPYFFPHTLPERRATSHPPSSSSNYSRSPSVDRESPSPEELEEYSREVDKALDFLELVMAPESTKRITPRMALYHPFLRDPSEPEDDELVPHPVGLGACREYHFKDEETDEQCARVKVEGREGWAVRRVLPGEAIAIGKQPCELHRNIELYPPPSRKARR